MHRISDHGVEMVLGKEKTCHEGDAAWLTLHTVEFGLLVILTLSKLFIYNRGQCVYV
jgi:hypothetical protein